MEKLIKTSEMSHEDWLQTRQRFIGGSDVSVILGLNPFRTPYELWMDKLSPMPIPIEETERMRIGSRIEDFIAELYMEETGRKVIRDNKIRIHPDYPFMAGNVDRIITKGEKDNTPGILEIKNVDKYARNNWTDDVPLYYYTQLQHYLGITGYEWGEFCFLVGGNHIEIVRVEKDNDFLASMYEVLDRWWADHVINKIEPEKGIKDFSASKFVEGAIDANAEMVMLIKELQQLKSESSDLDKRVKKVEELIKTKIGDNEQVLYNGDSIASWKVQTKTYLDQSRIAEEKPEIFNEYKKESTFRVLRTKTIREGNNASK